MVINCLLSNRCLFNLVFCKDVIIRSSLLLGQGGTWWSHLRLMEEESDLGDPIKTLPPTKVPPWGNPRGSSRTPRTGNCCFLLLKYIYVTLSRLSLYHKSFYLSLNNNNQWCRQCFWIDGSNLFEIIWLLLVGIQFPGTHLIEFEDRRIELRSRLVFLLGVFSRDCTLPPQIAGSLR